MFAVGLLGGTVVPKIIGNLSVGATVQQSLGIAVAMAAILFLDLACHQPGREAGTVTSREDAMAEDDKKDQPDNPGKEAGKL